MLIVLYLAAIIAANLLVTSFGPGVSVVTAFLFIGLDLTTRDALHDAWRGRGLAWRMAALIAAGSALSWVVNRDAGPIAIASFVAFAASASLDAFSYAALGERSRLVRINGSNVVSAAADSLLFPLLAFGWPLLWPIVFGQFVAKVGGGLVWMFVIAAIDTWRFERWRSAIRAMEEGRR
jgi:hypothetical protein